MRKTTKKIASLVMAGALVVTSAPVQSEAATATVKLNKTSATVTVGKTVKLKVSKKNVSSKNKVTSIKKTTWSSKKSSIASVSGGTVTGKKAGSTTIKCKVKYVLKKNGKSTTKTKTLSCTVKVNGKKVTPTTAPASQAPVSQAPASQAPTSQAPASQAPASEVPASGTPASGTPASQAPASAAPSASASAAPSASASAAPSATPAASASAAPSIVPATAAPANNGPTATPKALLGDYTGTEFAFKAKESDNLDSDGKTATSIKLASFTPPSGETIEVRISKVGDTVMNESAEGNYAWASASGRLFSGLTKNTKYTIEGRVKATSTHSAGKISTTEITTKDEELTISGTVTWKENNKVLYGGTGTDEIKAGDDVRNCLDLSHLTCKYGDKTVTPYQIKTQVDLNALTKNTSVKLEVVYGEQKTAGSGFDYYYGETSVVVLVKYGTPAIELATEGVQQGYVTIKSPDTLPGGLQYNIATGTNGTGLNATWTDVTEKTFGNVYRTTGDGKGKFTSGDKGKYIVFRINNSATPTAVGGWTGSTENQYIELTNTMLGIVDATEKDLSVIMDYSDVSNDNFEVKNGTVTLKTGSFTVGNDVELTKDVVINGSVGLTVPAEKTLTIPANKKITNNGTITNNGIVTGAGNLTIAAAASFTNSGKVSVSGTISDGRTAGVKLVNNQTTFETALSTGGVTGVVVANGFNLTRDLWIEKAFTVDLAGNEIAGGNKGIIQVAIPVTGTLALSGVAGSKISSSKANTILVSNGVGSVSDSMSAATVEITATENVNIINDMAKSGNAAGTALMVLNNVDFVNGQSVDISGVALSQITAATGCRKVGVLNYAGNLIAASGLAVSSNTLTFKRTGSIAATVVLPTGVTGLKYLTGGAADGYSALITTGDVAVTGAADTLDYSSVEAGKSAFIFINQ